MSLFANNILRGASGATEDYEIDRSLRFDHADDAYLSRTFGTNSSNTTKTFSFWVKRSARFTDYTTICATTQDGNIESRLQWSNGGSLKFTDRDSSDGTTDINFYTTPVYRDSAAWYHIVLIIDTTNGTAGDRTRIYVNGSRVTALTSVTNASSSYAVSFMRSSAVNFIGVGAASGSDDFGGYFAEMHFLDGTVKEPSQFGKTNSDTGAWVPKEYKGGGYGNNGFYLNFSDNSAATATTLGKDSSGVGNNWTPTNFATGDSVGDSPTNNFATLMMQRQPFESGTTLTEGNLHFNSGTGTSARNMNKTSMSNFLVNSGKWYAEFWFTTAGAGNFVGVCPYEDEAGSATSNGAIYASRFGNSGQKYIGDGVLAYPNNYWTHGSSVGDGDVCMVMLDMDSSPPRMYTGKNGQWADGSGNDDEAAPNDYLTLGNNFLTTNASMAGYLGFMLVSAGSASNCNAIANFGQDSTFSGKTTAGGNTDSEGYGNFKYTVPTDAKAMCSKNLPEPTIQNGGDYFNTVLYEGTGSTLTSPSVGFQPDLTWIKNRDANDSHVIQDSARGNFVLYPDVTQAEGATGGGWITEIADGFTAAANDPINTSGESFVGWCWKESATAGFDMVTFTGNETAGNTFSHSLGVKPELVIIKNREDGNQEWCTYAEPIGATVAVFLEKNDQKSDNVIWWNDTEPTSSVVTLGTSSCSNGNGQGHIAYLFASVAGFSKIGKYAGTGNADGIFVYTGFKPAWLMIKRTNDTGGWEIVDNKRNTSNEIDKYIYADLNNTEYSGEALRWDFLSNGFKMRTTNAWGNASGSTYLYMAFAEHSFKYANAR